MLTERSGQRGFALLEIIIAFLVLALGLGTLSVGVAVSIRSDGRTIQNRNAYLLAQSRLETAGISERLIPGYREIEIAKGYRLKENVAVVELGRQSGELTERGTDLGAMHPAVGALAGYWVNVSVEAADGTVVSLAALKLAPLRR
jgi:Tfp pilus assembly protein PilV